MFEQKMPPIRLETTIAETIKQSEGPDLDQYQQLVGSQRQGEAFTVEVQMKLHCDTPDHLQTVTRKLGQAIGGNIEIGETSIQINRQPSLKQRLMNTENREGPYPQEYNDLEIGGWLAKNIGNNVEFVHLLLGSALLSENVEWPNSSLLDKLTDREVQVLTYVSHGRTNAEIGETLHVSRLTVKTHLGRIARKLHLQNTDRTYMATAYLRYLFLKALQGIKVPED